VSSPFRASAPAAPASAADRYVSTAAVASWSTRSSSALVTSRRADGPPNFKLIGYGPLVISGVLLALLVVIIWFRVVVQPRFG
jgi:hypothetical protein